MPSRFSLCLCTSRVRFLHYVHEFVTQTYLYLQPTTLVQRKKKNATIICRAPDYAGECIAYGMNACSAAALSLGLYLGGPGDVQFATSSHPISGCFAYKKTASDVDKRYRVFYGAKGNNAAKKAALADTVNMWRPTNYDCAAPEQPKAEGAYALQIKKASQSWRRPEC